MDALERLTPNALADALRSYAEVLEAHREVINRLNVYPVPDGDTGTNMALTLSAVLGALDRLPPEASMVQTCEAIGHGALMGARGNSGLIVSQILRGMCEIWAGLEGIGPRDLGQALTRAAETARGAVSKPVEGTILSVASALAGTAACAASNGASLAETLERARVEAGEALARTPGQLEALARAGVVDAGGAGLVLMIDAFLSVVAGRPLPPAPPIESGQRPATVERGGPDAQAGGDDLRYEVMYLLDAPAEAISAFRDCWAAIGDSIVVVGTGELWNCHIHTDDIGAAIEAGIDVGRPRNIRVCDLAEQVEEERWVRQGAGGPSAGSPEQVTAVVAVANGAGIGRIFRSLGVVQIVRGGQSMNPSTAELLAAIESAPAQQVLVLPNNDNIVAVARQAATLSKKQVVVLPTDGVSEGFAALMEYDPGSGVQENAKAMAAAAARVLTGAVTRSVRSSDCAAGIIAEGDWLGLSGGRIEVVGSSPSEAACALLAKLCTDDHELVTLIEGEGSRPADTRRITEWLAEQRPRVTAEVHHGGQPLYPYLLSVE